MDFQDPNSVNPHNSSPQPQNQCLSPHNLIVIYTVVSILIQMKEQLGLEAMLEYMECYARLLAHANPKMEYAVRRAIALMNIEKMHYDALHHKK